MNVKVESFIISVSTGKLTQTFNAKSDSTEKLIVVLSAKALGFVTLNVKAVGNLAGDAIEQKLRVVPEGVPRFSSNSTIVLKDNNSLPFSSELSCLLPPTAVQDTITVFASVVGDILGSTLNNLESLIQMPYGCGEQNMLNFVPNIVILRYLQATNKLTETIKNKAVSYTEQGYQRELQYRRHDGSFSAFGNSDTSGSTWLTGFVLKSFLLARPYITIDLSILLQSLNYIATKQNADGSFREDGVVIHTDMQGGSSSGVSLTAYIAIVLTQSLSTFPQYESERNAALSFLASHYNSSDVYSLGITSYALFIGNHPSFQSVFAQFYNLAIETTTEIHWEKPQEVNPNSWWYYQPRSLDVEISAYGLLTLFSRNIGKSLKIIRWLVKQQNSIGGFQSTQDTVMALEALATFASQFTVSSSNLNLVLTPSQGSAINVNVNSNNSLIVQTFDLLSTERHLDINVASSSSGIAVVTLSCNFYEVIQDQFPRFVINHYFENPCIGSLKSAICLSFIPKPNNDVSNMVLMRMTLPSGFVYEERTLLPHGISVSFLLLC